MPRSRPTRQDPLATLARRQAGAAEAAGGEAADADVAYRPEPARARNVGKRIVELRLDELWLEHQPRELVPEEELQRLIAADTAQPAALLAVLRAAADADPYYAEVLQALRDLARSIASEGVLQPIEVVAKGERLVVRDGHRRCLASLLAEREAVPAVEVEEPTELEAVARPLIINVQRADLTALEKAAALLRLALLVGRRLADEEAEAGEPLTIEALLGAEEPAAAENGSGEAAPANQRTVTGHSRALARQARDRVCAMVGLQPRMYYYLLALNRLSPAARAAGRSLTARQLQPLTRVPAEQQAELVAFAARRNLGGKEVATLAQVAERGDRDAVARIMARMAHEEQSRRRTAVSWEGLLHAIPRDVAPRLAALRAELEALPPEGRQVRLAAMEEQIRLLAIVRDEFSGLVERYRAAGAGATGEGAEADPGAVE